MEKYFISEELFKLNVFLFANNKNSSIFTSIIVLNTEFCDVWHSKLGHVNLRSILKLTNLNLASKLKIDRQSECEIWVQTKQPRKPFKSVSYKDTQILELIHNDVCDSNRRPIEQIC